jgi:hypothetical protein
MSPEDDGVLQAVLLPYQLKALRQRMNRLPAMIAPETDRRTGADLRRFGWAPGVLKAGIRHRTSGTRTVADLPLRAVLRLLADRARRHGLVDGAALEAVVFEAPDRICAGFWP